MPVPPLIGRLRRALGVTRIARLTSLDRAGIEVHSAIRPRGHILQVCNGKGLSRADAELSALCETAELVSAETVGARVERFGSPLELRRAGLPFWPHGVCCGSAGWLVVPELAGESIRSAWAVARELGSGAPVWVPAQVLFCPPQSSADLGPIAVAWASNGTGAHPDPDEALRHALLEACERELLVRALPSGWTPPVLLSRRLTHGSLAKHAPAVAEQVERLSQRGFDVALFDLTLDDGLGLPLAGALLVDREEGPVPIAAGYACRTSPAEALMAALLEAAQSRLTDIHGAREDVAPMATLSVQLLRGALRSAGAIREVTEMPSPRARTADEVFAILRAHGVSRAAAYDLTAPGLPVRVIRVIVPGFRISELLV